MNSSADYMSAIYHLLAPGVTVIERGWLNCNQIALTASDKNVLIDSGYGRGHHAKATLEYVAKALNDTPLHWLINTHCHSDHMGGNRALRAQYHCRVTIPAGEVKHVVPWTEQSCWAEEMDQYAEEFAFDDTIKAGDCFDAGGLQWQAHAAPGHDMDALIYFATAPRILITGDALWERGLGFVWPQADVATSRDATMRAAFEALNVIEKLAPAIVVPGHGAPFTDVAKSINDARGKLTALEKDPQKNARHVAKSLFVFALLDKGEMKVGEVAAYFDSVPVYRRLRDEFLRGSNEELAAQILAELVAVQAVMIDDAIVRANMRV
jgi:glyoxylase-like metal-dependent hydrolase (beta-lactamase superfamily II)